MGRPEGPAHPLKLRQGLEEAGFEVEEIIEVRGGVFAAVDVVSFIVEHVDEAVIGVLAGLVANMISGAPNRPDSDRGVRFSVKDSDNLVIINVTGDGNWVQVHPRPEETTEEE